MLHRQCVAQQWVTLRNIYLNQSFNSDDTGSYDI
jgi:hypothetical protein